jgi:hypothetical protein
MFRTRVRFGWRQTTSPRSAQLDAVGDQPRQHRMQRPEVLELGEDQPHHSADLLIGVQDHLPGRAAPVAHRQFDPQRPAAGLRQTPAPHPLLDQVKLGLADRALETEQEPIVVLGRIVDAVRIREQGPRQRAQFKQLVPVPARAGQPRHLDSQHHPDVAQPDLGDQAGKARPVLAAGRGVAHVVVDHQHPRRRPPQQVGALDQGVLHLRGLGVVLDLTQR